MVDFKIDKIKIGNIKNFIKKIPRILAERPFFTFFFFLIISLFFSGFIFYKYVILTEQSEINIVKKTSKFEESVYQEVLDQWQKREERLKNIENKNYPNLFQGSKKEIIFPTSNEESISTPEATSTSEATSTIEEYPPATTTIPEKPISPSNFEKLLAASTLYEFYIINNGWIPSVSQRAKVWQEKGLGSEDSYHGTAYQNILLLNKFKEELVPL